MNTRETKNCQNCKQHFTIEPEDFDFYKKIDVPPPTFCPECRLIRRLAWRNERSFFHNVCKRCGKEVISVYPNDSGITVYCRPCWWSDEWDGLEYGVDFDPSRPFLLQLKDILHKVPLPDLFGLYTTLENSEYTNMVGYLKNCYFLTMADWNENCAYGSNVYHSKDSHDTFMLDQGELCYETVNCSQCYQTLFSIDCRSCLNISFSKDCISCSNCIGCVNLRNKQYYIFNKPYSKEEYTQRAKEYQPTSRAQIKKMLERCRAFWRQQPNKYMHEYLTNNVTGDYISNSKNVQDSFNVQDMENARFCALVIPGKTTDCYDHTHYGISTELLYETLQVGNQASRIMCSWFVITGVSDVAYSIFTIGGKHIFGSVGLKKREYCILNKQYTKEAYEKLRAQIIEQMNTMLYVDKKGREYRYGEFFPVEFSPFGYNTSSAQEFFPLSEIAAKEQGFKWKSPEEKNYNITISHDKIPDGLDEFSKTITEEILGCAHQNKCSDQCSSAFKIIQSEFEFYRRLHLPLPDLCPNCRHYQRLKQITPMKLWHRRCQCSGEESEKRKEEGAYQNTISHFHGSSHCPNEFETSYAPERPEIIYCEQCYQQEVV